MVYSDFRSEFMAGGSCAQSGNAGGNGGGFDVLRCACAGRGGALQGDDGECEGHIRARGAGRASEGRGGVGGEVAGLFRERAAEARKSVYPNQDRQTANRAVLYRR